MTITAYAENVASTVSVDPGKVLAYLGLNPSDPKSQAVVAVAQRYDLDPVLKHVIVIPKGGAYITRDGLLHVAHRSGQLDGIVVDQEPRLSEDGKEWSARVSVYRKDMGHPFTFPGRYPVSGLNREYAQEMALKAAEAHALRRAFDVAGLPALDEQRPEPNKPAESAAERMAAALADPEPVVEAEIVEESGELLDTSSSLAKALYAQVGKAGIPKDQMHAFLSSALGREVGSSKELLVTETHELLDNFDALLASWMEES